MLLAMISLPCSLRMTTSNFESYSVVLKGFEHLGPALAGNDWDEWDEEEGEPSGARPARGLSAEAHGNLLSAFTTSLTTTAIPDSLGNIQESAPVPVTELFHAVSPACQRVNSAVQRQSRDRVGGRFFMPDIIEAAKTRPTEQDYVSEEDPIAIYQYSGRGKRAKIRLGVAERLFEASTKGGRGRFAPVSALNIMDVTGKVLCRMYEPARPPCVTTVGGQPADVTVVWRSRRALLLSSWRMFPLI